MTGHEPLRRLRCFGFKPSVVWVMDNDYPISRVLVKDWHEQVNPFDHKVHARILLDPADVPAALDFRFLIGLSVHMECSRGQERAKRLFDALVAAGPKMVIAVQGNDVWVSRGGGHG